MTATKPLAVLFAVLVVATGIGAAAGSTYDTGSGTYAMDAQLNDGAVTVTVTDDGAGVPNATVTVGDESVGETNANGSVTFERPSDAFEVRVETGAVELKQEYAVENGSLVLQKSEFEMDREEDDAHDEDEDEADDDESTDRTEDEADSEEGERDDGPDDESEGDENAEAERGPDARSGGAAAAAGSSPVQQGPPASLPAAVPDPVSAIHDLIRPVVSQYW
ncbi:MAG: hypothetical protein ABEI80_02070 [Haloplanus sp.]